jgi:hypothetical protein
MSSFAAAGLPRSGGRVKDQPPGPDITVAGLGQGILDAPDDVLVQPGEAHVLQVRSH